MPYARILADKLKLDVELIHVIDPGLATPTSAAGQSRYQQVMAMENEKGRAYLEKIAVSFSSVRKVQCSVQPGNPAEVVIDKAAEHRQTLIAMTTHGRSGFDRWLIGSVADKVLHGAANPLLLVRAGETAAVEGTALWRRMIVPLDGSPLAERVLAHATELARPLGLEIALMRVFGVPTPTFAVDYGPYVEELWNQVEDEAQKYLADKKQQLLAQGFTNVATIVTAGFAAEKIIEAARERKDALVAMCTHGRSGVNRFVMGSVTDRVVRHGGDPVLIIRAQE